MNRATMRGILRRRLNETDPDNWSDADLNVMLNVGLQKVEQDILKIDPEFVTYEDKTDIVAAQTHYPVPTDFLYETRVWKVVGGVETEFTRLDYPRARGRVEGSEEVYTRDGNYLVLLPTPSTSVANGLHIAYVPLLTMASDSDTPIITANLHLAVVVAALKATLPETGEGFKEAAEEYASLISDLPLWYRRSATDNSALLIDYDKGY